MDGLYGGGCPVCAGKKKDGVTLRTDGAERMAERVLKRIREGFDVKGMIDPDLFANACNALNEAVDEAVKLSVRWGRPDKAFIRELKRNNAVFAAFKAHREQNDLARLLTDDEGNTRSFDAFRRAAEPLIGQYNVNWLQTEYTTAVRTARTAVRFKQYDRDSDLYPNAEWLPSRAAEPRMSHRKYYHTVRRLTDPWWETHFPGCVWGCQCDMRNTDKPVTHIGDDPVAPGTEPGIAEPSEETTVRSPGLSRNPARSGELFSRDHPYFTTAYPGAEKAVRNFVEGKEKARERLKQIKQEAKSLRGKDLIHPAFNKSISVSGRSIDEWTNQPHMHMQEKNELLLHIQEALKQSTYRGFGNDKSTKPGSKFIHLFETTIAGDKSWIIVKEYQDGKCLLYSVSDSEEILKCLNKNNP